MPYGSAVSARPAAADADYEAQLLDDIAGYTHDPLGHALYAYSWGAGELAGVEGPRTWQREVLDAIGAHLRDASTRFMPCRVAIASGHGIGKSALIAMVVNWAMDTCEDCRVVVTANTEPQLRTKTWPEISKWRRLAVTSHWFKVPALSMYSTEPDHEKAWRADAATWSKENTEAFAGLHNKGKRLVVIMDEGSAIDDKVWEVTEGALTDEDTEILWLVAGNPTRPNGRFRECFRKFKAAWKAWQIDSRTVEGTNKRQLDEWAKEKGEDSDWYKVRVRGLFPNLAFKQFYAESLVDAAYGRHLRPEQYSFAPKVLCCDPAWEGDDELVIGVLQGLRFDVLRRIPKNDNDVEVANILMHLEDDHGADAVHIDKGYGTGIYSVGKTSGRHWRLVDFGSKSPDLGYVNFKAYIYGQVKKFLEEGGAIQELPEFRDQLLSIETVPTMDGSIQFEKKKDMKKRGLPSPGLVDALAIALAYPAQKGGGNRNLTPQQTGADWDPYA
jgi:hypothetical protein